MSSRATRGGVGTPVLLYHHVGEQRAGTNPLMTITPHQFVSQMGWLARHGYTGIGPARWLAWRDGAASLPRKPVIITFDDAYADIATHALPVLLAHGFTAAVFVPTAHIGGTNAWDIEGGWATSPLPLLDADAIAHWHGLGIEFGAHSHTHRDLRALDAAALEAEMAGSATALAHLLGERPVAFAYPHGLHDARVRAAAARVFRLAFTCDEDGLNYHDTPAERLRRVIVLPHESQLEFGLRVRLGWTPVEWLRRLTRHRFGRSRRFTASPQHRATVT